MITIVFLLIVLLALAGYLLADLGGRLAREVAKLEARVHDLETMIPREQQ